MVRERYGYGRRWAALLVETTELISFVMSQRMLRGIKSVRSERRSLPRAYETAEPVPTRRSSSMP